jgi:hypothetical protein
MIHAIWPTVTIRPTDVTVNPKVPSADDGDYVDWVDACQAINVPVEGDGTRTQLQLSAAIDPLYAQIPNASMSDWHAVLPNVAGLDFWTAAQGGTPLTPDGNGNLIDQALSGGSYTGTVYVSEDPVYADTQGDDLIPCSVGVEDPGTNAKVAVGVQTVESNGITARAVTSGVIADYDQQITIPRGQNQGPYILGSQRELAYYATGGLQGIDLSKLYAVGTVVPPQPFPTGKGQAFGKYTGYYYYFGTAPNTQFLVIRPYALTFDYVQQPGSAPYTFTVGETNQIFYGTTDRYATNDVDWGQPTTVPDHNIYTDKVPVPATNSNVGLDGTNIAWGYVKQNNPNAPPIARVVLTDAPSISGLFADTGATTIGGKPVSGSLCEAYRYAAGRSPSPRVVAEGGRIQRGLVRGRLGSVAANGQGRGEIRFPAARQRALSCPPRPRQPRAPRYPAAERDVPDELAGRAADLRGRERQAWSVKSELARQPSP